MSNPNIKNNTANSAAIGATAGAAVSNITAPPATYQVSRDFQRTLDNLKPKNVVEIPYREHLSDNKDFADSICRDIRKGGQICLVDAPCGAGKTYVIANTIAEMTYGDAINIILMPTSMQPEQAGAAYSTVINGKTLKPAVVTGSSFPRLEEGTYSVICCVYDSVDRLLEAWLPLDRVCLWIDESHSLVMDSYRDKVLAKVYAMADLVHNAGGTVMFVTGTSRRMQAFALDTVYDCFKVDDSGNRVKAFNSDRIDVWNASDFPNVYETADCAIEHYLAEGRKPLLHFNDIRKMNEFKARYEEKGFSVRILSAMDKGRHKETRLTGDSENPDMVTEVVYDSKTFEMLTTESAFPDADIYVVTSILQAGTSIEKLIDENGNVISAENLVPIYVVQHTGEMDFDRIRQFFSRPRCSLSASAIVLTMKNRNGNRLTGISEDGSTKDEIEPAKPLMQRMDEAYSSGFRKLSAMSRYGNGRQNCISMQKNSSNNSYIFYGGSGFEIDLPKLFDDQYMKYFADLQRHPKDLLRALAEEFDLPEEDVRFCVPKEEEKKFDPGTEVKVNLNKTFEEIIESMDPSSAKDESERIQRTIRASKFREALLNHKSGDYQNEDVRKIAQIGADIGAPFIGKKILERLVETAPMSDYSTPDLLLEAKNKYEHPRQKTFVDSLGQLRDPGQDMKDYCLRFIAELDDEKARCLMHWYAKETGLDRSRAFDGNEMLNDVYSYAAELEMITKDKHQQAALRKAAEMKVVWMLTLVRMFHFAKMVKKNWKKACEAVRLTEDKNLNRLVFALQDGMFNALLDQLGRKAFSRKIGTWELVDAAEFDVLANLDDMYPYDPEKRNTDDNYPDCGDKAFAFRGQGSYRIDAKALRYITYCFNRMVYGRLKDKGYKPYDYSEEDVSMRLKSIYQTQNTVKKDGVEAFTITGRRKLPNLTIGLNGYLYTRETALDQVNKVVMDAIKDKKPLTYTQVRDLTTLLRPFYHQYAGAIIASVAGTFQQDGECSYQDNEVFMMATPCEPGLTPGVPFNPQNMGPGSVADAVLRNNAKYLHVDLKDETGEMLDEYLAMANEEVKAREEEEARIEAEKAEAEKIAAEKAEKKEAAKKKAAEKKASKATKAKTARKTETAEPVQAPAAEKEVAVMDAVMKKEDLDTQNAEVKKPFDFAGDFVLETGKFSDDSYRELEEEEDMIYYYPNKDEKNDLDSLEFDEPEYEADTDFEDKFEDIDLELHFDPVLGALELEEARKRAMEHEAQEMTANSEEAEADADSFTDMEFEGVDPDVHFDEELGRLELEAAIKRAMEHEMEEKKAAEEAERKAAEAKRAAEYQNSRPKYHYTVPKIDPSSESYQYYSGHDFDDDPSEYADPGMDPYVDPDVTAGIEHAEREDQEWRESVGIEDPEYDDSFLDDEADAYYSEMSGNKAVSSR